MDWMKVIQVTIEVQMAQWKHFVMERLFGDSDEKQQINNQTFERLHKTEQHKLNT